MCKSLKGDEIGVIQAIEFIVKKTKQNKESLEKMKAVEFEELPTFRKMLGWIQEEGDGVAYQGIEIELCDRAIACLKLHRNECVEACGDLPSG